ncbi:MAG: transposase [Thaumarchaeota archaeon]|jgi:hypothetical protein|nr:transposase [Candidatus Geocrenenecus arthurdayi]
MNRRLSRVYFLLDLGLIDLELMMECLKRYTICYVLITGCKWMDMPIMYGSYKTIERGLKDCMMKA